MKLYDNDAYREKFMEIVYGILSGDETNDRANQIIDAFDNAPQVEVKEPPVNDPLTLEDLREMDGEKIFVRYIDGFYTDEDGAYFGKFEQLVRECNGRLTACELPLEYYGKTWLAYRRKPEESLC